MFELIPKTVYIDWVGKRRLFAGGSFLLSFLGILLFFYPGPTWSIDFTGGTEVEMHFAQPTSAEEVRATLAGLGISEDSIQPVGDKRYAVRVAGSPEVKQELVDQVRGALTTAFGSDWIADLSVDAEVGTRAKVLYTGDPRPLDAVKAAVASVPGVGVQASQEENTVYIRLPGLAEDIRDTLDRALPDRGLEIDRADSVGPRVGASLRTAGITSMLVSMALLLVYIGARFDFTFAPGAILCLFHDVTITVGFFVLTGEEFGLSMVSALLTLTGYSLNDTIVVYDRIRENLHRYRRKDFGELINDSINQTLSRTIMTSVATALAMLPFLVWGGPVLHQFAKCMLFGIAIGTYSSIGVAAPLTLILKENSGFFQKLVGIGGQGQGETADRAAAAVKKPKPWERPKSTDKAG